MLREKKSSLTTSTCPPIPNRFLYLINNKLRTEDCKSYCKEIRDRFRMYCIQCFERQCVRKHLLHSSGLIFITIEFTGATTYTEIFIKNRNFFTDCLVIHITIFCFQYQKAKTVLNVQLSIPNCNDIRFIVSVTFHRSDLRLVSRVPTT